jgi:hypothetical protein
VLKPFFELISGMAGLSFVISGTYNYFLFHRVFSLNYFVVAGPNDIVMSAFLVLLLMSFLLIIYVVLFGLGEIFRRKTGRMTRRWTAVIPAVVIALIAFGATLRTTRGEDTIVRWFNEQFYLVDYGAPGLAGDGCEDPHVRWLGEDALVFACGDGVYRVLKGLESAQLVTRTKHDGG